MPEVANSSATILVTGANGFIATWIVGDLLKKGYTVRAAVRTESKGKHLLETYKSYGHKLQLVAVGDMGEKGAFDEAVKGVDGILHTASPLTFSAGEPGEVIDPAVNGMLGILKSALENGSSVRRIVITSSCLAIIAYAQEAVTVSEVNWNDAVVVECREKGKDASPLAKYAASKTLAERAAWEFYEKHKSEINWDICALNPPVVFGPLIHEVTSVDIANGSTKMWYDAVVNAKFGGANPLTSPGRGWVDVRDVSEAHVLALETPAAGGERIILSAGSHVWQDWLDIANSLSPSPYPSHTLPKGTPGDAVRLVTFDTSKAARILKIKFRTMQELTRDTLADYERRGW